MIELISFLRLAIFAPFVVFSALVSRAIGMSVAYLAKAVLNDNRTISPVSTCVRGLYGITEDVFLAVPCSIGSQGVQRVAILPLTPEEESTLQKSAKGIWEVQKPIWEQLDAQNV